MKNLFSRRTPSPNNDSIGHNHLKMCIINNYRSLIDNMINQSSQHTNRRTYSLFISNSQCSAQFKWQSIFTPRLEFVLTDPELKVMSWGVVNFDRLFERNEMFVLSLLRTRPFMAHQFSIKDMDRIKLTVTPSISLDDIVIFVSLVWRYVSIFALVQYFTRISVETNFQLEKSDIVPWDTTIEMVPSEDISYPFSLHKPTTCFLSLR